MKATRMQRETRKARNKKIDQIVNNKVSIRRIKKSKKTRSKTTYKNQKKPHKMRVKNYLKTKIKIFSHT